MIKIVFTASDTWIGRLIRCLTRGKVSHVMIQYPSDLWGGEWIAEATATGVRKIPADRARHHVMAEFQCSFDPGPALKKISAHVGSSYDYAGVFVLAWAIVSWRLFRRKVRRPLNNTKGQFCSEFVSRFFRAADLPGTERWNPERSSPQRLLQYCTKHPDLFVESPSPS